MGGRGKVNVGPKSFSFHVNKNWWSRHGILQVSHIILAKVVGTILMLIPVHHLASCWVAEPSLGMLADAVDELSNSPTCIHTYTPGKHSKVRYLKTLLSLSLPRAINLKFLLQPHQKYYITQYEELGFSYLTQMKDDYTTNIILNAWECTFWTWEWKGKPFQSWAQKVHFPSLLKRKCISKVVRICIKIIFHLSKLWKAKFSLLCDVIFPVGLEGKFDIDNSQEWKV